MEKRIKKMKKISIIGPESSGKTTLAIFLSKILQGIYVNEYARDYLNKNKTYTNNDLDIFAFKQTEIINIASKTENDFLFADTSVFVIEIWSMLKYKKLSKSIKTLSEKENFDCYLLCKPDIPWKWDKQRENPNDRIKIYNTYKNLLSTRNYNYTIISGKLNQRIKSSLNTSIIIFAFKFSLSNSSNGKSKE